MHATAGNGVVCIIDHYQALWWSTDASIGPALPAVPARSAAAAGSQILPRQLAAPPQQQSQQLPQPQQQQLLQEEGSDDAWRFQQAYGARAGATARQLQGMFSGTAASSESHGGILPAGHPFRPRAQQRLDFSGGGAAIGGTGAADALDALLLTGEAAGAAGTTGGSAGGEAAWKVPASASPPRRSPQHPDDHPTPPGQRGLLGAGPLAIAGGRGGGVAAAWGREDREGRELALVPDAEKARLGESPSI